MNKESLEAKKESLTKSLESLQQQAAHLAEQITMHRGAIQYNDMLLKEIQDSETKAKEEAAKPTLAAVAEQK